MSATPETAMILAAGHGKRMRPLTDTLPKPLVSVAGRRLIDRAVDALAAAGVARIVVNVHHLADRIEAWARSRRDVAIEISDERSELLDTGGGIAKALPRLGAAPFFVLNSDGFWIERGIPALRRLAGAWDDASMDCLLLLCDPGQATGYDGKGDFLIDGAGRLRRRGAAPGGLAYIGAYIVSPRLFGDLPERGFSMNLLWDRAIARGRLFGLRHEGHWLHVGTPGAIEEAERHLGTLA